MSTGKEFDKNEEGKIKLSELRNAEIAFVPAGKGISTSECNAVVEGKGAREVTIPRKYLKCNFSSKCDPIKNISKNQLQNIPYIKLVE